MHLKSFSQKYTVVSCNKQLKEKLGLAWEILSVDRNFIRWHCL